MTPNFKLLANDKDITEKINKDTSKIEFQDEEGDVADQITLVIEGTFKKPKYEDELKLWIGTQENGLFYCGLFSVQTSTYKDGSKTSMVITATSANFSKNLKVKRNQSYENASIKKIMQIIASRHELEVASDFDDIYILHLEQTNESDLHFMKRLAAEYNALFAVKNNKIVFKHKIKDNKKSSSLPRFKLPRDEDTDISIQNADKTLYYSCQAVWHDTKENKQQSVTVGDGEPIKLIKDSFESMADAKIKAEATLQKANAGIKVGTISNYGFELYAGGILEVSGTPEDDGDYSIKRASHILDENGWNVTIDIEN